MPVTPSRNCWACGAWAASSRPAITTVSSPRFSMVSIITPASFRVVMILAGIHHPGDSFFRTPGELSGQSHCSACVQHLRESFTYLLAADRRDTRQKFLLRTHASERE